MPHLYFYSDYPTNNVKGSTPGGRMIVFFFALHFWEGEVFGAFKYGRMFSNGVLFAQISSAIVQAIWKVML